MASSAPPRLGRRACLAWFALILGVHAAWQGLICRSLAGGNLTALFLIGDRNRCY